MSDLTIALAKFARASAHAYSLLAEELEASAALPQLADKAEAEIPLGRGQRQQQILEVSGLGTEEGLKTSQIAEAISYEVPNTHSTLQVLSNAGLIEQVPHSAPQRWRLASRYRTTSAVFMRIASRVREGEWTTYGDISIAVRGDTKAARGVGSAARALPNFPHPERVLMNGGVISPQWRDSHGNGPDHCRKVLEKQGVKFNGERADGTRRVTWDQLIERDESEPVVL